MNCKKGGQKIEENTKVCSSCKNDRVRVSKKFRYSIFLGITIVDGRMI